MTPEQAAAEGERLRAAVTGPDGRTDPFKLSRVTSYEHLQALEDRASTVRGRHYIDWIETLDRMRADGRDDDALALLLEILDAAERHARVDGREPAPAYTERAAVIYRRRKDHAAEVAVLERWMRACPPERRAGSKIEKRLIRARELAAKTTT